MYLATPSFEGNENPAIWQSQQGRLLDLQVKRFQQTGRAITIVIGPDGDELLRHCRSVEDFDLVYDPTPQSNLESQAQAVLRSIENRAWVWPVNQWLNNPQDLDQLEAWAQAVSAPQPGSWVRFGNKSDAPRLILRGNASRERPKGFGRLQIVESPLEEYRESDPGHLANKPSPNSLTIQNPMDFQILMESA